MSATKGHVHGKRTPFTLVGANRLTFTPCDCGTVLTASGRVAAPIGRGLANGTLLVTTPRQAAGAYGDRTGGVVAQMRAGAKLQTLEEQLEFDPRGSDWTYEERMGLFNAIVATYIKG